MSPDDSLMNMDYVGTISDGGDRKAGRKTCPNDSVAKISHIEGGYC
jgi:hypothetical protein